MAIEFLDENSQKGSAVHKYCYEVGSLIWVFTWVSRQYLSDGTGFLEQVGQVDALQCAKEKSLLLRLIPDFPDGVDKHLGICVSFDCFLVLLREDYKDPSCCHC